MTSTDQDTTLYAGKDYTLEFTEINDEDLGSFSEITYAFASSADASSSHFTKTKTGGDISTSGNNDEVASVSVTGSDLTGLTTGAVYYHELVTEDAGGNEQVAATGTVLLRPVQTDN